MTEAEWEQRAIDAVVLAAEASLRKLVAPGRLTIATSAVAARLEANRRRSESAMRVPIPRVEDPKPGRR